MKTSKDTMVKKYCICKCPNSICQKDIICGHCMLPKKLKEKECTCECCESDHYCPCCNCDGDGKPTLPKSSTKEMCCGHTSSCNCDHCEIKHSTSPPERTYLHDKKCKCKCHKLKPSWFTQPCKKCLREISPPERITEEWVNRLRELDFTNRIDIAEWTELVNFIQQELLNQKREKLEKIILI